VGQNLVTGNEIIFCDPHILAIFFGQNFLVFLWRDIEENILGN